MPRDPILSSAAARVSGTAYAASLDAAGRRQMNAAARLARAEQLRVQFAAEVDPDGSIAATDPAEFDKRMALKRKEHFARLALASARSRRAKQEARKASDTDAELAELAAADLAAEESA